MLIAFSYARNLISTWVFLHQSNTIIVSFFIEEFSFSFLASLQKVKDYFQIDTSLTILMSGFGDMFDCIQWEKSTGKPLASMILWCNLKASNHRFKWQRLSIQILYDFVWLSKKKLSLVDVYYWYYFLRHEICCSAKMSMLALLAVRLQCLKASECWESFKSENTCLISSEKKDHCLLFFKSFFWFLVSLMTAERGGGVYCDVMLFCTKSVNQNVLCCVWTNTSS